MRPTPATLRRSWVLVVCAAIVLLGLLGEARHLLNPDAAWLLYSAQRVLRGEHLYRDILEINPPLIVWLNLPVAWLAGRLTLPAVLVFRTALAALAVGSVAACAALVPNAAWERRCRAAAAVAFALFILPGGMFGQREHLALALILPFMALAWRRAAAGSVRPGASVAVGTVASLGFALKPQFGVVWLGILAARRWAGPAETRRWYPEDTAVVAAGLAYPLLVLVATPEYLRVVTTSAHDYLAFGSQPLARILLDDSPAWFLYAALGGWLLAGGRARRAPALTILAAAGLGFLLAVALQHKGWSYHYYPMLACALLLALGTTAERLQAGRLGASGMVVAVLVGACASLSLWLAVQRAAGVGDRREARQVAAIQAVRALAEARQAHSMLVLSSQLRDAFPLVNESGLRWTAGYPTMWFPLVYYRSYAGPAGDTAYRSPGAMPPPERAAFERVVRDVVDGRPDLLVVESRPLNAERTRFPGGFDYLAYFAQDSGFAATLAEYAPAGEVDGLRLLSRHPAR